MKFHRLEQIFRNFGVFLCNCKTWFIMDSIKAKRVVVDSGATKTDWCFIGENDGEKICKSFATEGINQAVMKREEIVKVMEGLATRTGRQMISDVEEIEVYGAGIVTQEGPMALRGILRDAFPNAYKITLSSDLVGAARALFGNGSGVAAIMGTGSNSCLYRSGCIIRNIRPGGFILGDEGSGAALGRMLLADFIKECVPEDLHKALEENFDLSYPKIVSMVYQGPSPSRFLASFAKFLLEHKDNDYVSQLIDSNIRAFIERSLSRYGCSEVGVVGSFGYSCRESLERIGAEYGLRFVRFLKSPIEGLI